MTEWVEEKYLTLKEIVPSVSRETEGTISFNVRYFSSTHSVIRRFSCFRGLSAGYG